MATALIHAPCEEVLCNVPGTFADVFRFQGPFTGTVAEVPVLDADPRYAGLTRAGGSIDANISLRAENARATLRTTGAELGAGRCYQGFIVTRR